MLIKFSFIITALIAFQSFASWLSRIQIDSNANLIVEDGFGKFLISTKCCFLICATAVIRGKKRGN